MIEESRHVGRRDAGLFKPRRRLVTQIPKLESVEARRLAGVLPGRPDRLDAFAESSATTPPDSTRMSYSTLTTLSRTAPLVDSSSTIGSPTLTSFPDKPISCPGIITVGPERAALWLRRPTAHATATQDPIVRGES